jgi:hypothetical protein
MNNKRWNSALKSAFFVTLLGIQGVVLAGRVDSSMESAERAQGSDKRPVTKGREQPQAHVVHDNARSGSIDDSARDAQLADYLEMHGRLVEGSIRSTMMPWSALQQVAN